MYRTATSKCGTLARFGSGNSIYLNGTVFESPRRRRHSSSHNTHDSWPSNPHPTPYEIMGIQKNSKYLKSRYFDLVKIYHPDNKASPLAGKLLKEERLARYRLIVDAYDVLSDKQKRSAYDKYGLGWAMSSRNRDFRRRSYPDMRHYGWNNDGPDDKKEHKLFDQLLRNKSFICLIVVIATFAQICIFLSSLMKAELEMRRTDKQCRELMTRHRDRALSLRTLLAQMERLLLKRDFSGTGLSPAEEPVYREMLPLCIYSGAHD